MKHYILLGLTLLVSLSLQAQNDSTRTLKSVSIRGRSEIKMQRLSGAENGQMMGLGELKRAACCNLGESFVTNPSVDVNYSDAAVGAKQIKLLGLSGLYVQMLTENMPNLTGAATPYALNYVPGTWMRSISVSKGASSVKHGFQSITGQIDVEYLKPDEPSGLLLNLFGDSKGKAEGNIVASRRLTDKLGTEVLAHYEKDFSHLDHDGDLWHDSPSIEQIHLSNRWKYMGDNYIFHGGLGFLSERREGGQILSESLATPYRVLLNNNRFDAHMKHAYIIDHGHNTNIALIATFNHFDLDGLFGAKDYLNQHNNLSTQLLFEHDFDFVHSISAGLSFKADNMNETLKGTFSSTQELVPGAYAQYTFTPTYKFTAMVGIRADYSNLYGAFATPRMHLKWMPADWVTIRGSLGKGYRVPYALAENHFLLASGRQLNINPDLNMEEAWNTGISAAFTIPVAEKKYLKINYEEYYTNFLNQAVINYDSDPLAITIDNLDGRSYSHTIQVDATYPIVDELLEATAAFRINDVRCTYDNQLREAPLTSRLKGLFTASWKPRMGLWQVDLTLQINGGSRMPDPYTLDDGSLSWAERFPAYPMLNAQITRNFRHYSIYIGGENLTNYRQPNPIINAATPWSNSFEPTMIWGPMHGIMGYFGIRANLFGKDK